MRLMIAVGIVLAVFQLTGCSGSESEQQPTTEGVAASDELAPGYTGGCNEGFTLYVQNQFSPFGSKIRRELDRTGESVGLRGNEQLKAVGWTKTEHVFYPDNPPGLQGVVWFYVPELPNNGGSGWIPDAGVRAVTTEPSPGNRDEDFDPSTQAAPQAPGCELFSR